MEYSGMAVRAALATLFASLYSLNGAAAPVDVLRFGDPAAEQAHRLTAEHSDIVQGALGEPARRLLPQPAANWRGGALAFELAVDPAARNYVTLTLWGGEVSHNRLTLECEGKLLGLRHLGDTDLLDLGSAAPMYAGRFFHNTSPLPAAWTKGKTKLACRIDGNGPIWAYGQVFEKLQKPMVEPSRGLYALTVHTDPFLAAGPMEQKGKAEVPKVRPAPGPEVLESLKRRVGRAVDRLLTAKRPLNQPELLFLARAYDVDWTSAHRNAQVGAILAEGLDAYFQAFRAKPEIVGWDPTTFNPDWFGLGMAGQAVVLRHAQLAPLLDQAIDDPKSGKITRRAAYAEMLAASREWHRVHRRFYTNQSMINDTYGIYLANRGVALLDPAKAAPERDMLRYLYESAGLQEWRGDDLPGGGHSFRAGGPDGTARGEYRIGRGYHQVTERGLTREFGYVGNYGEVLDWVAAMYDATRPAPGQPGDALLRAQLLKVAKARASFRYPLADADGYRAMRLESVVGWRDTKYPGDVVYAQRPTWDASSLQVAEITRDPTLVGYAQQMFDDNQFFHSLQETMRVDSLRVNMALLDTPAQYAALAGGARSGERLPMSEGQPDMVFSDEEAGVVSVKVGQEIFYASLYWRALNGVNGLAKVHYMTPQVDRMAVVGADAQFAPSGQFWTRPERAMGGSDPAFPRFYYPGAGAVHTGEKLPIAKYPEGFKPIYGEESPYAGKAELYTLRYGPFTVVMNTTTAKSFDVTAPAVPALRELVTKRPVAPGERVKVGPRSTLVFYGSDGKP